jgi:hypothetical protein
MHSPDLVSEGIKGSPYGLPMLSHKGNSWPKTERTQAARAGDGTRRERRGKFSVSLRLETMPSGCRAALARRSCGRSAESRRA